jgi:methylase of polypeptide subunit release factors
MRTAELYLWHSLLRPLCSIPRLRCLRLAVAGLHFQVDAISLVHDHIWDCTSLVLHKAIRRYLRDDYRVLDLGTGHIGLLAVYCSRIRKVEVLAVDVNQEFIENARIVAEASGASTIEFRQSDWFSNVDGEFDLIFGNVPYIPTEVGAASHHSHQHPEIWDGGYDGLEHARAILDNVGHFLLPNGALLLGIDADYIPRLATLNLVEESHDLELCEVLKSCISKSEVYVIVHKCQTH